MKLVELHNIKKSTLVIKLSKYSESKRHFFIGKNIIIRALSSVVERLLHTQEVVGSIPTARTIFFFVSDRVRK